MALGQRRGEDLGGIDGEELAHASARAPLALFPAMASMASRKLGFTEGYPPLDVGENVQKGISMHAAQYTTTPISWALKHTKKRAAPARTSWRN